MSEAICHCNTYRKLPGRFPKLADSLEFQLFLDYDHPLLFNDHTPTHQLGNLKPLTWSSAFVWREEIRVSQFIHIYTYIYIYTCGLRFGCLECSWNIKDAIFLVRRIDLQGWRCHILKPPKCHLKKKSFRTQKAAARKSLSFAQDHICPYHWMLQPWHVRIFTCALNKPVIRIRIVGTRKTQ